MTTSAHVDAGAIPALLERLNTSIPFDSIDELWLFPTRRIAGVESTVVVLALYTDQPDRRRVATAHFKTTRTKRGEARVETDLRDHAIAPADRLTRVIDGVLRRLGDDLSTTPPRSAQISGAEDRWLALIEANASNVEFEEALDRIRVRLRALGREDLISISPEPEPENDVEQEEPAAEPVSEQDEPAAQSVSEQDPAVKPGSEVDDSAAEPVSEQDEPAAEPVGEQEKAINPSEPDEGTGIEPAGEVLSDDDKIRALERTGVEERNV